MLLGSAGSGKSAVLQQMFEQAIEEWQEGDALPIYFNLANEVEIGKIIKSIDQELNTDIQKYLKGSLVHLYIDSFD